MHAAEPNPNAYVKEHIISRAQSSSSRQSACGALQLEKNGGVAVSVT
jgi:hypothetical protein